MQNLDIEVIIGYRIGYKKPKECYCISICNSHGDGDLYTYPKVFIEKEKDFINVFLLVQKVMSYLKNNAVNVEENKKISDMVYDFLKLQDQREVIEILGGTEDTGFEEREISVEDLIFNLIELDITNMNYYARPTNIKATYFDYDGDEFELKFRINLPTDGFFDF